MAHQIGALLVVDNTFATFVEGCLVNPIAVSFLQSSGLSVARVMVGFAALVVAAGFAQAQSPTAL
jgi:cystathionine beta-lyase/cystathionine gamma-synthase